MDEFQEGDYVWLRARVHRANHEQAFIEFESMEGAFSVRVPLSELRHRKGPWRVAVECGQSLWRLRSWRTPPLFRRLPGGGRGFAVGPVIVYRED